LCLGGYTSPKDGLDDKKLRENEVYMLRQIEDIKENKAATRKKICKYNIFALMLFF